MAYFIQNNFVQINLNKNDLNKYRGALLDSLYTNTEKS